MRYMASLITALNEIASNRACAKDAEKIFKRLIVVKDASTNSDSKDPKEL